MTTPTRSVLDRYGRNAFGWSLLMARRLVEAGVNLVQVNLGNNETWDTHGNVFPHLKDKLFPPTDRALSALLDDLHESGLLDSHADRDGRRVRPHAADLDAVRSTTSCRAATTGARCRPCSSAGGGVRGGRVVGSSDRIGASGHDPADAGEPGRHHLPGAGHAADGRLARRAGPAALHLSRRADPGPGIVPDQGASGWSPTFRRWGPKTA